MNRTARIYVAGGDTLIGAALIERLRGDGYRNLVGTPPDEPDLTVAGQVEDFFGEARPEYVFLAAGKSGGIRLNQTCPADLMLHNLLATAHVVDCAHRHGVTKLLYLASSCSYPKLAPQPMAVESLLTGPPEPTNAAYATAKLAGWRLCDAYRQQHGARFVTAIPANVFGPQDDFSPDGGHVIPALIRKAHEAKLRGDPELTVWGSGKPRREFLFARDQADACLFTMRHYEGPGPINLGGGTELSVAELARLVADVVGYRRRIRFDPTQPDGMSLKMLDSGPLRALGWRPSVDFMTALRETYDWFLQHAVTEDTEDARAAVPVPLPDSPG
jgi:GDP-L-fucose synthase